jgi:transposase
VTELYSLIAATAAKRLGLTPTFAHLDTTSFHVDGRYNSAQPPDEQVVHITQGYSRDHRPDRHWFRLMSDTHARLCWTTRLWRIMLLHRGMSLS